MFPVNADIGRKSDDLSNLSIALLGNRIHCDQTLYEYLIEFLLVFASAKDEAGNGKLRFHTADEAFANKMKYHIAPQTALRRFVFYNNSKQESRSRIDTIANDKHWEYLRESTLNGEEDIDLIHDLLHSYAIVTRNRGWYAQALLPVAPQLLLTDLQGIKNRQKATWTLFDHQVDDGFDFDKHNFLARGGQVIYLHLLQGLMESDALGGDDRSVIERLLGNMFDCSGREVGILADFVERKWEANRENEFKLKAFNMGYIQDDYAVRSVRFVKEIRNFLSCNIHPIARIELLAQGLVLSLLRVIHIVAEKKLDPNGNEPLWVLDMSGMGGTSNIARLASASFMSAYNSFISAMAKIYDENNGAIGNRFDALQKGKQDTADIFKNLGKEIKIVVPPRGGNERFSMSESVARYLVLALVEPGTKITFDSFLRRLYDHYRMVIGPEQYRKALDAGNWKAGENMTDYFEINARCFQDFLKQCGFVRDLSDATAIVENPYQEVSIV